jgi:tetratricopeptide (TPR) repeat protein
VREVIGRRLDHLGEDAVSALEVAAVIGPDFSIDVAGSIAGLDEQAIDAVVEVAMNARSITEGDDADEFSFAHALLRQTLYDGLPTRRRMRIHREVGEALEVRGEPSAALLNHWLSANENEKALACALAAASAAGKSFAGSDVVAHLELALDIWDDVRDADQVAGISHAQLLMRLSEATYDFGGISTSSISRLRDELDRGDIDDATRALLLNLLSTELWVTGQSTEAKNARLKALRVVPKSPPNAAHARVLASTAANSAIEGEATEAIDKAHEALTLARSVGDQTAEQTALLALGTVLGQLGRIEESQRYFDELTELAYETGVLKFQLIRYVNEAEGIARNGSLEDALRLTEEGIARASDLGVSRWEAMLRGNAADMTFNLGRWDEAEEHLTALAPNRELDFPQINCSLIALKLAAERGNDHTTEQEVERLRTFVDAGLDPQVQGNYWECRVSDLRWHGDLAGAYEVGSESLDLLATDDDWPRAPNLAPFVIETVADAVNLGVAETSWIDNARNWHTRLTQVSGPMLFGDEFRATATADLSRAEGDNDPDLWRAAVEAWGDQAYYGAKARWRLAQALTEQGPTDPEIASLLAQAEEVAVELKANPLLEAVRATREKAAL